MDTQARLGAMHASIGNSADQITSNPSCMSLVSHQVIDSETAQPHARLDEEPNSLENVVVPALT